MPSSLSRCALTLTTVLALTGTTLTGVALSSPALATAGSSVGTGRALAVPADLVPVVTKTSLTGTHRWFSQTFKGLPVVGSYYVQHLTTAGALASVADGRQAVPASLSTTPRVSGGTAAAAAKAAVTAKAASAARSLAARPTKNSVAVPTSTTGQATLAVVGGASPALVWSVISRAGDGVTRSLVDAQSGAVREVKVLTKNADGAGKVFDPNPVVALRNEGLTDKHDANQAVLAPAYKTVKLAHLNGSGSLVGTYARVVEAKGGLAHSANNSFLYQRANQKFEQVNAYYGIDAAQTYIHKLGFTDVNNESQDLLVNTYAGDNSFYDPSNDTITYGEGGVDDAEDLEVVWHEYGHAIQDDQSPGYGESEEAGATGEGFGDYWAVTMSQPTSKGFELPCVMDWDATSYTTTVPHCLRRTDTGKTIDDKTGEVHDDGEIWSNALWDINRTFGRDRANKIILESQFYNVPDTSFAAAARNTVASARALYGSAAADAVTHAFHARKIL